MRKVPGKSTANTAFGNMLSLFHISFLPFSPSEVGQYSTNRKYRLHNQLATLHIILSINLFENSRKKIIMSSFSTSKLTSLLAYALQWA